MTMTIVSIGIVAPSGADAPCVSAASDPTSYPQLARVLSATVSEGGAPPSADVDPPPSDGFTVPASAGLSDEEPDEQPKKKHDRDRATALERIDS